MNLPVMEMTDRVRAAVLLSGSGRTLQNFLDRITAGDLPLEIVAVVSSTSRARGLSIAAGAEIPHHVFPRKKYSNVKSHNAAINLWLGPHQPELIILAGYLSYYLKSDHFDGPVVNIHPALLPKYGGQGFYGDRVHEAVLAAGDAESGCTVHLVDDVYDNGQILAQKKVAVRPTDDVSSLAARVFEAECELYPQVLSELVAEIVARR